MNASIELTEVNQRIGQLFMAGMPGTELDEGTASLITDYHLGGIILFARNILDPLQLAKLCRDLQELALEVHGIPLFLAVDQEGGRVARLKEPFTAFQGNRTIGQSADPEKEADRFGRVTAREMRLVGLNMNLAPVVDVQQGVLEKHLEGRTFGEDPEIVSTLGRLVVKSLQENGIMAVAKHFPGLGKADLDPHSHLPRIGISKEELERINLPPFQRAIGEGVTGIMTSHAIYPHLDPDLSATLSGEILSRLLRGEMGFEGLILTDDMEMGAIERHWGIEAGSLKAFEAGADILLICENQAPVKKTMKLMRRKVLDENALSQRLNASHERIIRAKSRFIPQNHEVDFEVIGRYFQAKH